VPTKFGTSNTSPSVTLPSPVYLGTAEIEERLDCELMPDNITVLPDYFVNDGVEIFAGTHLLVDVIDAKNLKDPEVIRLSLERAALDAGATVLHSHFHSFGPGQGVSGMLVLAESHISIHTWPDRRFAAIDIFMCGKCDPMDTLPEIRKTFSDNLKLSTQKRGLQIQAG